MTEQEEKDWPNHPDRVYIINGRKYDYRSANHNGLVGMGKQLKEVIRGSQ